MSWETRNLLKTVQEELGLSDRELAVIAEALVEEDKGKEVRG